MTSLKGTSILNNPLSYRAFALSGLTGQQKDRVVTYSMSSLGAESARLSSCIFRLISPLDTPGRVISTFNELWPSSVYAHTPGDTRILLSARLSPPFFGL